MPYIVLLGDHDSGHGCWPSRANDTANDFVFIEGVPIHCEGDHWLPHTCVNPPFPTHDGIAIAALNDYVRIDGKAMCVIGDPVSCGSVMVEGNTFVSIG